MTIKNVTIGDKFINNSNKKTKRVSTVVDFIEKRSLVTGEILGHEAVSETSFLGQSIRSICPFATVVRNRVN